jgi:hypothetical protein
MGSGRRGQEIWVPGRVDLETGRRVDPSETTGRSGLDAEMEPTLCRGAIPLADVAGPAAGNHVLPAVVAALRPGCDMVDRLGRATAVLTGVTVPPEHGPTGDRDRASVRHLHVAVEPHHRGELHRTCLRRPDLVTTDDDRGPLIEDEHHGTTTDSGS